MKFLDLKEFHFDPVLWSRMDTTTALKFYREWVHRSSVQNGQQPRFFEADRSPAQMDPLWHTPKADERTQYTRRSPMELPAVNQFQKPDWKITRLGITPGRRDNFLVSTLDLQALDYFPTRGDAVFWRGYRYEILNAIIPPEAYWQQTGVWLGLCIECIVPPEGDARPIPGLDRPAPAELSPAPIHGPASVPQGPLHVEYPLPQNARMLPEKPR